MIYIKNGFTLKFKTTYENNQENYSMGFLFQPLSKLFMNEFSIDFAKLKNNQNVKEKGNSQQAVLRRITLHDSEYKPFLSITNNSYKYNSIFLDHNKYV